jgi:hypothetical protein
MATTTNNGWTTPNDTDLVKDGALAIRTLGNGIDTSTGKGLIAWQSFAPTLSGGWLNGNGVWEAYYCQIGKTVHVDAAFTLGSTTTKGSIMTITLPVTAKRPGTNVRRIIGSMIGFLTSGFYPMLPYQNSATTFTAYNISASGSFAQAATVTAATPITWATGDSFHFSLTYEAA